MTDPKPPVYDARLENLDASPVNPQRIGRFVKVVRIPRGRMNAGTWWQLTDGRGSFWQVRPDRLRLVPDSGQAREPGTPVFGTDPADPFRLQKWAALADDVCMFAGCNASETDQRGPVWLRGDGMAKACTEHWEPIMRVLGEQATWERADAYRSGGAS